MWKHLRTCVRHATPLIYISEQVLYTEHCFDHNGYPLADAIPDISRHFLISILLRSHCSQCQCDCLTDH